MIDALTVSVAASNDNLELLAELRYVSVGSMQEVGRKSPGRCY